MVLSTDPTDADQGSGSYVDRLLGFTLGRRPFFFEHDRPDGPVVSGRPTLGSWYRMPDDPVTERYNHGLQYQNDVAREVARRLLDAVVGPVPQRTGDSFWP